MSSDSTEEKTSFRDWLRELGCQFTRPSMLVLVGVVAVAALALNWSWLAAAGLIPFVACAVMCGLSLCFVKRSGKRDG